mgnify:CR=1 FL=1
MGLLGGETPRETTIAWGFVVVQAALILAVLLLPAGDAWALSPTADTVATLLEWVGMLILVVGLVNLGRSLTALPTPVPHGELKVGGLYRLVRHPIYTGVMALVLGAGARSGNPWAALAAGGLVAWFAAKARWEEGRLRARYPGYDDYAAATPRFVPGWPFGADRT